MRFASTVRIFISTFDSNWLCIEEAINKLDMIKSSKFLAFHYFVKESKFFYDLQL